MKRNMIFKFAVSLATFSILVAAFNVPLGKSSLWIEVSRQSGSAFPNPAEFSMEFEINYVNWRVRWSYVAVGYPFESLLIIKKNGELFVYSEGYFNREGVRYVYNETGKFNLSIICVSVYEYTIIVEQDVDSAYARTIYIRSNGSVDPQTAPLTSDDNITYTLTDNIFDAVIVVERDNIIIDGNGYGLFGRSVPWSKGLDLSGRKNVTIQKLQIFNYSDGIYISTSSDITISKNMIANNSQGIWLWKSLNVRISDNVFTKNYNGLIVNNCSNVIISRNDITNSKAAGIWLMRSSNNNITRNNIKYNYVGISLVTSYSKNIIYHNNFINNTRQLVPSDYTNALDNGYPSGGNYWSDYVGVDTKSGPNQDKTGCDGIGDTPYVVDKNNRDRYPLMNPWGSGIPIARFSFSPNNPKVNEPVTFDASTSSPAGGEILSYEWDFGDGNRASGKIVTHKYASEGNYTITLTVTDSEGLCDIEEIQIEVKFPLHTTENFIIWIIIVLMAIVVITAIVALKRKRKS
ncbi:MAG: NosD domain-containing protein [Nitrososphaeria archaeon]